MVGCGPVFRQARLAQAAALWTRLAHGRRAPLSRSRCRTAVRTGQRLGSAADTGFAAPGLGLHEGARFPRHDYPEAIRRQAILRLHAFASSDEAVEPLLGAGRNRDGAQFAGAGRTAAALRHRRTEKPLSATPGRRHRDSLLCADQSVCGFRRGRHSRPGRGLHGHA
ncbi:hypothetical protein D3C81_1579050 [compost metagenome]